MIVTAACFPVEGKDELAHDGEPEGVVGSAQEACRRGIALFDEQRFFEAHAFFEYAWKADDVDDRDRRFWKGVTQVAVGCCHAQRGNGRGALALLERAACPYQKTDPARSPMSPTANPPLGVMERGC